MSTPTEVVAAIYDVARALREAGKSREQAELSLRTTTSVSYHGHVTDVLNEVFPADPILDLCLQDDFSRLSVISALKMVAAGFRVEAARHREDTEEMVADAYDECARDLLRAFGLPVEPTS